MAAAVVLSSASTTIHWDSPIVAARESIAWIPVLASVSAAAVMVLLCSFLWHTSRRNHLYEEELQENGQNQTGILGSRESTTGNDNTDDTLEEGNQQVGSVPCTRVY
ncbi:hypothetical protein Q3G72_035301 [Acer saccharum]|nr:hypothetical protein Q3G72_035301 [Acer saccharum]